MNMLKKVGGATMEQANRCFFTWKGAFSPTIPPDQKKLHMSMLHVMTFPLIFPPKKGICISY